MTPLTLPYPPLAILACTGCVSWAELQRAVGPQLRRGVSLCLISPSGPQDRGGYFFHVRSEDDHQFVFSTFDRRDVCTVVGTAQCAAFINHVSGRRYDEAMWLLSQRVNLRNDQEENEATGD